MQIADGLNSKLHCMYYCYCNGCWLLRGKNWKTAWDNDLVSLTLSTWSTADYTDSFLFRFHLFSVQFLAWHSSSGPQVVIIIVYSTYFFFIYTSAGVSLREEDLRPISEYSYGSRSITFVVGNNSPGSLLVSCARKRIKDMTLSWNSSIAFIEVGLLSILYAWQTQLSLSN